jgi:hypothetical protein
MIICVRRYTRFTSVSQTITMLETVAVTSVHPRRMPEFHANARPPRTGPKYATAVPA